jgi:hypothetical protein
MGTEIIVALIAAAVAVFSAALTLWGQYRTTLLTNQMEELRAAEQRRLAVETSEARYREPLARAAYDLQSRLYNILAQDFMGRYSERGGARERAYAIDNTTFVIGQYFAWTEIIRREIQYIDLGKDEQTSRPARLQDEIYFLFQTDRFPARLRVFAGEQRAIGERMIGEGPRGPVSMGYATFLDQLNGVANDVLTKALRDDVEQLSGSLGDARPRLIALQHAMIDLLAFLDPEFVRFPKDNRTKYSPAS